MNRTSYFIEKKALFGSYPSQSTVNELEKKNVKYFVDLTEKDETLIVPYSTKYNYINFPIKDRKVPDNWRLFSKFIIHISNLILSSKDDELFYIHCKGGHGRSGVIVACILCYIFKIPPEKSLNMTTQCHNKRIEMKDKWRKIGSPQTDQQKKFVMNFFQPLNINRNFKKGYTQGFSLHANTPIYVENFSKTFPNAQNAILAFKMSYDTEIVESLSSNFQIKDIKLINEEKNQSWDKEKLDVIKKILMLKYTQHPEIFKRLLNTGLRPIIFDSNILIEYKENFVGNIIEQIRNNNL